MSELFSLARMAARLGVTRAWLLEEAKAGRVPCLPAGRRFLFSPVAVQEALAVRAARTGRRSRGRQTGPKNVGEDDELATRVPVEPEQGRSAVGVAIGPEVDPEGSRGQTGPREPVSLQ